MSTNHKQPQWRRGALAGLIAGGLMTATSAAFAGECPTDRRVADGQGQKMVAHAAKGVTDKVRATLDLGKESIAASGRLFRIRQLDIAPGGVVPWHAHDDRPAHIYIVKGEIIEYASNCAVPILHKAGEISSEGRGTSHWWQNKGTEPVVLISVDIFNDKPAIDKSVM